MQQLRQGGLLKSQNKEDEILLRWFNGLCNGTYIEMGALDGVKFSNSFAFNKGFGWEGLLIELIPSHYQQLVQNRPNEIATVQAGVCDKRQMIHYVHRPERPATGGIYEFASVDHRERWWGNITLSSPQVKEIQCIPLKDIVAEHGKGVNFFDFFSLDVEGSEFEVLRSIDYASIGFGIILLEANFRNLLRKNYAARTFLESNGYIFLMEEGNSYWFINKNFWSIYKHLLKEE
jgi:FkbM family methyltransferase